jgi:thioredoxin
VLRSPLPALVDFWAPWCGPCRMVSPLVEAAAGAYAGRLRVAKLNTDENPRTAGRYNVTGIPTLIFYRDGYEVDRLVGAHDRATIDAAIRRLLARS